MPPRRRRRRPGPLVFDRDPHGLLRGPGTAQEFGGLGAPGGPAPSQVFRLLRPYDLVALDVLGFDLALVFDADGPALVPDGGRARLEVRFPFQHLGEKAYYEMEGRQSRQVSFPPGQAAPPGGVPPGFDPVLINEPVDAPAIEALAARTTRLVYAVPAEERIAYSIEGVLAAMSRLPLLVAPLATPSPAGGRPSIGAVRGLEGSVAVLTLPGGYRLARTGEGLVLVGAARRVRGAARLTPLQQMVTGALALRSARALLVGETAIDTGGGRYGDRSIRELVARPTGRIRTREQFPRAPRSDESAIEAPFRLVLSPSTYGAFAHATAARRAPKNATSVELWHTRLGVRRVVDDRPSVDERPGPQRVVRAIWARDKDNGDPDEPPDELPFRMSLNAFDRVILVRQSADPSIAPPQPVEVERLHLSSLGASLGLHGAWDIGPYAAAGERSIVSWDHEAPLGRDQYVRVVYPGYLFPTGHRAALVKVTERKVKEAANPQAYLHQRKFLVVSEPVRSYADRRMPFTQIRLLPLVTPNLRDPLAGGPDVIQSDALFWPAVGAGKFRFTLDAVDHDGRRVRLQAPLLFVAAHLGGDEPGRDLIRTSYTGDVESRISGAGQAVAYAPSTTAGQTSMETVELRLTGEPGRPGEMTSAPWLARADIVIPALRHLAPAARHTTVTYAEPYVALGFTGKNAEPQVYLSLKDGAVETIEFSSAGTDRAGGFLSPDLPVRGLARVLGAVGNIEELVDNPPAQRFDPVKFLAGVTPKLFGLFALSDLLDATGLEGAPSFVTEQLDRVAGMLADLDALEHVLASSVERLSEDAATAATDPLQDQAAHARAQLQEVLTPLQPQFAALVSAVQALLDLEAPSSETDVRDALEDTMAEVGTVVVATATVLREVPLPPAVKASLERLVGALTPALAAADVFDTLTRFVNGIDPESGSVRARYDWRPRLHNMPVGAADDAALFRVRKDGLLLSVEARASGSDGVGVDVLAELRDFSLRLFPGEPLIELTFDRLAFRSASGRKPEVDVVFRGIEFVGVLAFIEVLRDLIPFDGFADPPYLDVTPAGVTAGFDLALPNVAVGVFSLENISLGADARVPFLGEVVTVGFNFCSRAKPFRLTVMAIGGGGFVGIRLSPNGLVLLEMALEGGASLSIDLGVASGSVSVMVGVYLRLEETKGSLTGYFRIRGEVDVMGLISASITLELSLTYEFSSGKMVGRASVVIEVEVLLFSGSVEVSCERRLAGSNDDPPLAEMLAVQADGSSPAWDDYCAAFAGE